MPTPLTTTPREHAADELATINRASLATKLAFFIAGFGLACWAPMVPYAKAQLGINHSELGGLLLCLGLGSVLGMPAAGSLSRSWGAKRVIVICSLGLLLALPLMAQAKTALILAFALLLFGICLGAIDVAANIHGAAVQTRAARPMMSGFHAFYSIGGLAGAAAITALLAAGLPLLAAATTSCLLILSCVIAAAPRFLKTSAATTAPARGFTLPNNFVVLLGVMALLIFLIEGAVLDWSAVLLSDNKHIPLQYAGTAYVVFALAMTAARLVGDRMVLALGNRGALLLGSLLTLLGVALAAGAAHSALIFAGFATAGFGAANIVPVLFSLAGNQRALPADYAIAVTSTLGYLGIFMGPALIGYAAGLFTLPFAFGALAALMLIVAALSFRVTHA